jgi:hypothetical protein
VFCGCGMEPPPDPFDLPPDPPWTCSRCGRNDLRESQGPAHTRSCMSDTTEHCDACEGPFDYEHMRTVEGERLCEWCARGPYGDRMRALDDRWETVSSAIPIDTDLLLRLAAGETFGPGKSVQSFIAAGRAAGQDAFGIAHDTEAQDAVYLAKQRAHAERLGLEKHEGPTFLERHATSVIKPTAGVSYEQVLGPDPRAYRLKGLTYPDAPLYGTPDSHLMSVTTTTPKALTSVCMYCNYPVHDDFCYQFCPVFGTADRTCRECGHGRESHYEDSNGWASCSGGSYVDDSDERIYPCDCGHRIGR